MSDFQPPDIPHPDEEPEPTCGNCAAWTGEECRCNPPVPVVIGQQVVTVYPRTAASAWCLMHQPAGDEFAEQSQESMGAQNG